MNVISQLIYNRTTVVSQLGRYGIAGAIGTLAHYITIVLILFISTKDLLLASTIGAIIGALINYFANYFYTFKSNKLHTIAFIQFWLCAMTGWVVNFCILYLLTLGLNTHAIPAQLIATLHVFLLTFYINRRWTFQ